MLESNVLFQFLLRRRRANHARILWGDTDHATLFLKLFKHSMIDLYSLDVEWRLTTPSPFPAVCRLCRSGSTMSTED